MREIKFRGKREDNGEWVYGFFCKFQAYKGGLFNPVMQKIKEWDDGDYLEHIEVIPSTVGQFTGLHDMNGVEIYEGDIVCFIDATSTESGLYELSCIGTVSWEQETASFQVSDRLSAESYEVLAECEVIGNIHDNPELLEVRQ